MAKMKFGVDDNVSTDSGFAPYEGPLPKPNTIYPVSQRSAAIRLTGENSKKPGTEYISSMWEVTDGECKGYTVFHRLVPGDSEIQQSRIAQYMQAMCGKNSATIVHDEIDDGGKVKTVGGKKIEGVTAGMTFTRVRDTYGVPEGEEAPWKAEAQDLIPGWKPKSKVEAEDEEEEEPAEEEDFDEEEEDVADKKAESSTDSAGADWSEGEDEDGDEDDEEGVPYAKAAGMSLVQLKKLAKEYEYEDSDLNPFKGPAGKKKLLAKLLEDEILIQEGDDEPPF